MEVRKITLGLVTIGIPPETEITMGFITFPTLEASLEAACWPFGRHARLGIILESPLTLLSPVDTTLKTL
jgi:hypothetical protein